MNLPRTYLGLTSQAGIPSPYCPCAGEADGGSYTPRLGVCHGDSNHLLSSRFCASHSGDVHVPIFGAEVEELELGGSRAIGLIQDRGG